YDSAGNRIGENRDGSNTVSQFGPADEETNSTGASFVYDPMGNEITEKVTKQFSEAFTFNVAGEMVGSKERLSATFAKKTGAPRTDVEGYLYAPSGERSSVQDTQTGLWTHFIW